MKKSELKKLIRECINEIGNSPGYTSPPRDSIDANGTKYFIRWITSKDRGNEGKAYSMILFPQNKKLDIIVFPNFAYYTTGWSQGTNRSEYGYYLTTPSGGAGNGKGKSSQSVPRMYDLYYDLEDIKKFLEGKTGYGTDWYTKNSFTESPGTSMSNIKSSLS